jgi:hypothetical protein
MFVECSRILIIPYMNYVLAFKNMKILLIKALTKLNNGLKFVNKNFYLCFHYNFLHCKSALVRQFL